MLSNDMLIHVFHPHVLKVQLFSTSTTVTWSSCSWSRQSRVIVQHLGMVKGSGWTISRCAPNGTLEYVDLHERLEFMVYMYGWSIWAPYMGFSLRGNLPSGKSYIIEQKSNFGKQNYPARIGTYLATKHEATFMIQLMEEILHQLIW